MTDATGTTSGPAPIPPDDPRRRLALARPDEDGSLPHIGLVGDTYTILLTGEDTAGRYCLIDMHVPPGGGPPPHRHDFEEMFSVLEGEIEATFHGEKTTVRAGETVNVPANAPHSFTNASERPARLLCVCSPAGQEEFFSTIGVRVGSRTEAPPELDEAAQAEFVARLQELAPWYRSELLGP
ncbi:MAG: cupin domain-containing protein [Actinomycetota bacterium]|nr:cupin domain-containing protein [Actinomycetota bacterium]